VLGVQAISVRRRIWAPVAAALAVLALAGYGEADPGNWVVVRAALDRWAWAVAIAGVLLIIAAVGIRPTRRRGVLGKNLLVLTLVFLTAGCTLETILIRPFGNVEQQIAAPGGRPYRLIIASGTDLVHGFSTLTIRAGSGLTARDWRFACVVDIDSVSGLSSAAWDGPARVVVTLEEVDDDEEGDDDVERTRVVPVPIDPATGRPTGAANTWDGCGD
jgi:hypothetical protein